MRCLCRLLTILCLFATVFAGFSNADWPQFRGPNGQGTIAEAKIPLTWSETEHVAWSAAVAGKGWSSPVVLGDQIWLTTGVESPPSPEQIEQRFKESGLAAEDFKRRQVAGNLSLRAVCFDLASGKLQHDIELIQTDRPAAIHTGNSYASATPVIEPGRLYCHFAQGTCCLDIEAGRVLWKREFAVDYSVGCGSSPMVHGDLLVVPCDGIDQQFVVALDKHTGKTVWQTPRPPIRAADGQQKKAYSTPLLVEHDGREQLIIPGAQWVISYEPATGRELWRVDHGVGFSNVPRPIFGHGMVFICTGFGSKELWAIRVDGEGDVTSTHVAWKQNSQIPTNSSPVLVDDMIFLVSDVGIAGCFDVKTGEQVWKQRIGMNFSASPIAVGNRVYFFSHEGEIITIAAAREYQELARGRIDGQIMASPAVLKDRLILRSDTKLYCIE